MPSYDRRDPAKAYEQVVDDIRQTMRSLEEKLRLHSRKREEKPEDWGHVGDVTHVLKSLQDIHDFISGEAKG